MIVEVEFNDIALADADEGTGDAAAVGPEGVFDPVGELGHEFAHLEVHDHPGRILAAEGWRHVRRGRQDRLLHRHVQHLHRQEDRPLGVRRTFGGTHDRGGGQRGGQNQAGQDKGGEFSEWIHDEG